MLYKARIPCGPVSVQRHSSATHPFAVLARQIKVLQRRVGLMDVAVVQALAVVQARLRR